MADGKEKATPFEQQADEEIVLLAQQGDSDAMAWLLDKYKNLVRTRAHSYFLVGADHEDIVQEGMIGLFKAVRDYRNEKQTSFKAFAEICVKRQMITAIKTATRQKHLPLNCYISLNRPLYDEESDRTLMDVLEGQGANPEELFIGIEASKKIQHEIDHSLSELEKTALSDFLAGMSYQEIAAHLGRHTKAIDNALQRVKKKLLVSLEEGQDGGTKRG